MNYNKIKLKPITYSQVTINQNVPFSSLFINKMKFVAKYQYCKQIIKKYLICSLFAILIAYTTYLLNNKLYRLDVNFKSSVYLLKHYNSTTNISKTFNNLSFDKLFSLFNNL